MQLHYHPGNASFAPHILLQEIGAEDKVDAWLEEQFAKKAKIMGIGHRVYKVLDPRAPHLRNMAIKLTEQLGEPKWIRMSERIAEVMRMQDAATKDVKTRILRHVRRREMARGDNHIVELFVIHPVRLQIMRRDGEVALVGIVAHKADRR